MLDGFFFFFFFLGGGGRGSFSDSFDNLSEKQVYQLMQVSYLFVLVWFVPDEIFVFAYVQNLNHTLAGT